MSEPTAEGREGEQSRAGTGVQNGELHPDWSGKAPVNYRDIRESFVLAMQANGDIDDDTVADIVETVDEAVVNNERHLSWEDDSAEAGC